MVWGLPRQPLTGFGKFTVFLAAKKYRRHRPLNLQLLERFGILHLIPFSKLT